MRVKIFSGSKFDDLDGPEQSLVESIINKWLIEIGNIEIVHVTQSSPGGTDRLITITIFYRIIK